MPSRRSGSYSRSRSRSRSPERRKRRDLPYDAKEISQSDYFQKIDEFKIWLKQEKDRVLRLEAHYRLTDTTPVL